MILTGFLCALPARGGALEVDTRTAPVSGTPLVVDRPPRFAHLIVDWQETFDGSPVAMTLSDGARWRGDPLRPRGELTVGVGLGRISAAAHVGAGTAGVSAQADLLRGDGWLLATTGSARVADDDGWDLSIVPAWSRRLPWGSRWRFAAFGALRARWGQTVYEVQGWSGSESSPFASALTRDLAVAPMGGLTVSRWLWELRLTAGWELLLVDRIDWEARPTALDRSGGPLLAVALRFRVPRVR